MTILTFLGTGHGMPRQSSCSSLFLEDDTTNLLIDAGGGHDLLYQFFKAKKDPCSINNIFISHYDSDHILGIVPLVRAFHRDKQVRERKLFCPAEVKRAIDSLFLYVAKNHYDPVKNHVQFVIIKDKMEYELQDWKLTFFDVKSTGSIQFGCKILFPSKKKLAFLGDEPLRDHYLPLIKESDTFIHNAFCLDKDKDQFRPHEKNHSTVKEAAQNAAHAAAKQLILFHMEDETLASRKKAYTEEAKAFFSGDIVVPTDGEVVKIC